jgi:hypothetical protein
MRLPQHAPARRVLTVPSYTVNPPTMLSPSQSTPSSGLGPTGQSRAQSDANGTRMLTKPSSRCAPLSESRSLTGSLRREVAASGLNEVQVLALLMTMPRGVVQAALRLPWSEQHVPVGRSAPARGPRACKRARWQAPTGKLLRRAGPGASGLWRTT